MLHLLSAASAFFSSPIGFSHPGYEGALDLKSSSQPAVPPTKCMDYITYGRCTTKLASINWTAPNLALPEAMRGVFLDDFDKATGFSNPNYGELLDYNMFQPYPAGHRLHGSFWVKQTTSHFWVQGNKSFNDHGAMVTIPLEKDHDGVLIATPHDEIAAGVWQFSYAFGGGSSYAHAVNVIDTFTSHKVSENVYRTEWYHLGKLSGSWPTYKVTDSNGKKTDQWTTYVPVRYENGIGVTWP